MTLPTTIRADQLGPQHMHHLIRVTLEEGGIVDQSGLGLRLKPQTRDLMLVGHRRCDCGRTTVMSPGHRQAYVLLPDAQVEILADVSGGRP